MPLAAGDTDTGTNGITCPKSYVVPQFDHLDTRNIMVSYFDHLDTRNVMVLLTMQSASCADGANDVT